MTNKEKTNLSQNFTIIDGKIIVNGQPLLPKEGIKPCPKHLVKDKGETSLHKKRKPFPKRTPFIESP